MGTSLPDYTDAQPAHEVCLEDFYIGKTEVTQKQWVMVMGNNPARFKGCDECPVENVTWMMFRFFIQKVEPDDRQIFFVCPLKPNGNMQPWAGKSVSMHVLSQIIKTLK